MLSSLTFQALLERHAALQSPSRVEELVGILIHATKVRVSSDVGSLGANLFRWRLGSGTWGLERYRNWQSIVAARGSAL